MQELVFEVAEEADGGFVAESVDVCSKLEMGYQ